MSKIIDFDELIAGGQQAGSKKEKTERKRVVKPKTTQQIMYPKKEVVERDSKVELAGSAVNMTRNSAKSIINYYTKSHPTYKSIQQQLEVLRTKIKEYKKAGETAYYQQCLETYNQLQENAKLFKSVMKGKTSAEIIEDRNTIANDSVIKQFTKELKALKEEAKKYDIGSLVSRLRKVRTHLDWKSADMSEIELEDDVIDLDDVIAQDSDEDVSNKKVAKTTEYEYRELLKHISELTGVTAKSLADMNTNKIKNLLIETRTDEDEILEGINNEIIEKEVEINKRRREITNGNDVTDLIHESFDNEADDYRKAKELLAATHIKYVEATAYKICMKLNLMEEYEEAVAIGYEGLAKAINEWEVLQRNSSVPVSFEPLLRKKVGHNIERGLLDATGNGTMSGSTRADKYSKYHDYKTKRIKELRAEYGEHITDDILEDIISMETEGKFDDERVLKERDMVGMIGGSDDDYNSSDIWSNVLNDRESDASEIMEAQENYQTLIESLTKLFKLFKKETDKKTGLERVTSTRFFDADDYLLFTMKYGLRKKQMPDGTEKMFTQTEMAEMLMNQWKERGISKTISQAGINVRLKNLEEKIQLALEQYPEIKEALQYIFNYWRLNRDMMISVSDSDDE